MHEVDHLVNEANEGVAAGTKVLLEGRGVGVDRDPGDEDGEAVCLVLGFLEAMKGVGQFGEGDAKYVSDRKEVAIWGIKSSLDVVDGLAAGC